MNAQIKHAATQATIGHRAVLLGKDGEAIRTVKNLGWIRHNWRSAKSFLFIRGGREMRQAGEYWISGGGTLICTLNHHRYAYYATSWASESVFDHWVHRPVFRGLPITKE